VNPRRVRHARLLTVGLGMRPRVTFVQSDATRLPFAAGSFTHAYSFEAFVHVREKNAALAEIFRVLQPGSRPGSGAPPRPAVRHAGGHAVPVAG
jgi:ubiquinone/menaquinone biosynthesis C-methylase UbiE